ncbi:MAG: N-acetylmuramoyl-L-alanine amidase [Lachnospiraceae bacterium]|nr:N-acetylmuramoyl-L-alanine amidase [Lachnospiraceae bacterium]
MKKIAALLTLALLVIMSFSMVTFAEDTTIKAPSISTVSRKGKGDVTIKWGKVSGVTGYQIQYSTNSDYSEATTVKVKKAATVSTTIAKDKVSTKANTWIRMRCYQTVDGVTTYSKWSGKVKLIVWKTSWKYAKNSEIHSDPGVKYYATKNKKGITVAVNAGHGTKGGASKKTLCHPDGSAKVTGGSTSAGSKYATAVSGGTTVGSKSEASCNLAVAKKVKSKLLAEGYNVLMIRQDSDIQLDNVARTVMANAHADCHIAIHYDSTTSNKGAFYIGVPDGKYRKMSPVSSNYKKHEALGKELVAGLKDSGVKIFSSGRMAIDLTQTSYSTIASVDIEVGDRKSSTSDTQVDKVAKGIVKGIKKYF